MTGGFDQVLKEINDFGIYQKLRYLLVWLAALLPPIVTYLYSFTAANPKARCKHPFEANDTYATNTSIYENIKLNKCDYVINGTSTKCQEWVFDKTHYHTTLSEEWSMVCQSALWRNNVQTVYFFGYMVGSVITGVLADRFGRRPIMLSSFIMMIIGGFGATFGPQKALGRVGSYVVYILSRFIIACGTRGINVTGFVLGMEMMGPTKRTFAGIMIEYAFAFGQLILVGFAYFIRDWRTLSMISIIPCFFYLSYFFILPESPRWLVTKNRNQEAYEILKVVAKSNKRVLREESWQNFLKAQALESENNKESLKNLKKHPKLIFICLILCLNWMINNFIFYGVGLKSNNLGVNPYLSFSISALVECASYVLTQAILDKLGRKLPYFVFLLSAGISCFSITFIDNVTLALVMAMIGKFSASASYAIIYLYSSELFPTSIRNSCMGACSMMARVGAMTAPIVNGLGDLGNPNLPFSVFGISGIIGSVTAIILPETLNRPLAQNILEADKLNKMGLSCKSTASDEVQYERSIELNAFDKDEMRQAF